MSDNKNCPPCPKGGKGIGGQAVIEGVMMRGKSLYALAVRNVSTKEITVDKTFFEDKSEKYKILKLPIFRGVKSFVDSLVMGMKVITRSAELSGMDSLEEGDSEEEPSKFEKWLTDKCGDKLSEYIIYFSVAISIIISIALFMVLPTVISGFVNEHLQWNARAIGVLEGLTRLAIFLTYIIITAQLKDVKRVFMYHGAEHKTINCFESNDELTVENVKKHTRLHKRCGTSFLILVMLVSMVVFFFVNTDQVALRILSRVILVPLIAGISYEIIKWAGRNDNLLVNIVSAPGLALQLITTSEPDDSMIEVAIASLKAVLEEEPEDGSKPIKEKQDKENSDKKAVSEKESDNK
ncbi:MAG: DUF1385 domain-containing protein [Firmicutes bacterium]|nr:DUF1385 domain-containing protein [Bacillota bacterium]